MSTITIVKELYPDVSQPTVTISVQYNGASVTEMRDEIVQPIEQNLAGTQDLQTINSVVQQGQATITAVFDITSDTATDLALTNKAVQAAEKYLPTNITPPTVNLYDPTESTVVVARAVLAEALDQRALALRAERHRAAARASAGHFVCQRRRRRHARPTRCRSIRPSWPRNNVTLNDVINTVSADNQRVPGGFAYEPNRQTTIDVRGDITTLDNVRNLPIIVSGSVVADERAARPGRKLQRRALELAGPSQPVDGQQFGRSHRRRRDGHLGLRAAPADRAHQRQARPLSADSKDVAGERSRRVEQRDRRTYPASSGNSRRSRSASSTCSRSSPSSRSTSSFARSPKRSC